MKWHTDGRHTLYPLGSTIVLRAIDTNAQVFLTGHSSRVTALSISKASAAFEDVNAMHDQL
jgi:hypothetical protein